MLGCLWVRRTLGAGPISPRIQKHRPSLVAGHCNTAAPASTRSGNDHPHASGPSLKKGPLQWCPRCPGGQCSARSGGGRPHRCYLVGRRSHHRRGPAWPPPRPPPPPPPEQTRTSDIMVVFKCRHDRPCCYALLCSCKLVLLLIVRQSPGQRDVR